MTRKYFSGVAAAAVMSLLAAPEADAATFAYKFYGGTTGYTGSFSGAGTVYDQTKSLVPTPVDTVNSSPDLKGDADFVANTIVFSGGGQPTITATAGNNLPWLDAAPNFGGLGVATSPTGFGDDQINGSEILRLQFGSVVTLTGIATLSASGHCCFGTGAAGEFNLTANPVLASNIFQIAVGNGDFQNVTFGDANNGLLLALNLTGDVFRFRQVTGQPEFYISALTAVPIPGAAALFVTGLAGVGYLGRRRRATTAA